MRLHLHITTLLMILMNTAFAQTILWNHTYGGDQYDEVNSVIQNYDGGFITAGYSQSFGAGRYGKGYIVRTDENGDTLWTKLFGGDGQDVFADITATPDSGCIVVGRTDIPNNYENIYVVKLDKNCNTVFEKNFGGPQKDVAIGIAPASDGGFIITGGTKSVSAGNEDLFLFKIDASGDSLWFKTYGTESNESGYQISPTSDGGFIVSGLYYWTYAWLLKTDANGDTLWTRTYGGPTYAEANDVVQTDDNGFIFCGGTRSMGAGELDAYVVKTDSVGKLIWEKTYGGAIYDEGRRIVPKPEGGYMILGNRDLQISGNMNYYLISTNDNGDTLWTKTIGNGFGGDRAYDIKKISWGSGYIIAGSTLDAVNYGDATLTVINDDSAPSGISEENHISGYNLYDAYPNPFNPTATIKYTVGEYTSGNSNNILTSLKIYDMLGNEVAVLVNTRQAPGEYEVKFNGLGLSSGIYFYRLQSGNFIQTKKLMLLK